MQGVLFPLLVSPKDSLELVSFAAAAAPSGDLRKIPLTPLVLSGGPILPFFFPSKATVGDRRAKVPLPCPAPAANSRTKWNTMMERRWGWAIKGFLKGRWSRRSVYPRKGGRRGGMPGAKSFGQSYLLFPRVYVPKKGDQLMQIVPLSQMKRLSVSLVLMGWVFSSFFFGGGGSRF